MNRHIFLTLFVASILALTSCGSHKSSVNNTDYTPSSSTSASTQSATTVFDNLVSGYKSWNDVQVPVKVSLTSPKSFSFSGRMSMQRGKDILLSFRILGMEVANVYVDADSVYAVDKYHKYFCSESLSRVFGSSKATISDVQDLLLGRAVVFGDGILTSKLRSKVDISADNTGWTMTPKSQSGNILYSYSIQDVDNITAISALQATVSGATPATCSYSSPTDTDAGVVAKVANITATLGKQNIDASLEWTLRSAKWNEGKTNSWSRPSGYQRIEAKNILKIFNSL